MPETDHTCIGRVRHVRGATVTVALDPSLAGVSPLWEGRLQPVGQVGSLVLIPQGPIKLVATVTLVGIAELNEPLPPAQVPQTGDRWLQVQLLGEIDGLGKFQRGVSGYPGIDDKVHFTTSEFLRSVYPPISDETLLLGRLSSAPDIKFTLAAGKLITRHCAIVGSTGSGKTSAVARILQSFAHGGWDSANIIVVDPHGEYAAAMKDVASVRSVLGTGNALLQVPFWALPANDILRAFCGPVESATIISKFAELVTEERKAYSRTATWIKLDISQITSDTPIPFDIKEVWYKLDFENNATFDLAGGKGKVQIAKAGDATLLQKTEFTPYSLGSAAPFKGPSFGLYGTIPDRLRARISDPRFSFFLGPDSSDPTTDTLPGVVDTWLGGTRSISVLDFSGVPAEVTDLAIGVVVQLLFEIAIRSRGDGIGRNRPVFIVLEEAHRYLSNSNTVKLARESVNKIAREGRKYGVGIALVTQRPSELPDTALAQCGTIIALRLTNATDQATVKSALPDSITGLADALPALRTGEAVVVGEASVLPTRVQIDLPSPMPDASDPSLSSWRTTPVSANEVERALARWRGI